VQYLRTLSIGIPVAEDMEALDLYMSSLEVGDSIKNICIFSFFRSTPV